MPSTQILQDPPLALIESLPAPLGIPEDALRRLEAIRTDTGADALVLPEHLVHPSLLSLVSFYTDEVLRQLAQRGLRLAVYGELKRLSPHARAAFDGTVSPQPALIIAPDRETAVDLLKGTPTP